MDLGNGKLLKEENPFRYSSYFYDNESELYYLKNRYYNPDLARFISEDAVDSNNLYIYADNNPLKFFDYDGNSSKYKASVSYATYTATKIALRYENGEQKSKEFKSLSLAQKAKELLKIEAMGNKIFKSQYDYIRKYGKPKPYTNSRPSYAKGQVQAVWDAAVKKYGGKVKDPNTSTRLYWDKSKPRNGQWDMGHTKGNKYSTKHAEYMAGIISKQQFLDWYRNPKNYVPENPCDNRCHKYE